MKEAEVEEQFRVLQQEVSLAGEAVETLKRAHRAEIDALRLDIEILQRSLLILHPESKARFAAPKSRGAAASRPGKILNQLG